MAFLAFYSFTRCTCHRLVRPPEIPSDFNNVRLCDVLLHFSGIGCGWCQFRSGTDVGSADRGRGWKPALAADFLFHAASFVFR